jgi:rubrerythrin
MPKIMKDEMLERLVEWSGLLDETAMWRPCAGLNGEKSDDDILGEIRALLTAPTFEVMCPECGGSGGGDEPTLKCPRCVDGKIMVVEVKEVKS